MLAGRQWLAEQYSVLDPYAFTFYAWGVRRELPMAELEEATPPSRTACCCARAVRRVVEDEKVKV